MSFWSRFWNSRESAQRPQTPPDPEASFRDFVRAVCEKDHRVRVVRAMPDDFALELTHDAGASVVSLRNLFLETRELDSDGRSRRVRDYLDIFVEQREQLELLYPVVRSTLFLMEGSQSATANVKRSSILHRMLAPHLLEAVVVDRPTFMQVVHE